MLFRWRIAHAIQVLGSNDRQRLHSNMEVVEGARITSINLCVDQLEQVRLLVRIDMNEE